VPRRQRCLIPIAVALPLSVALAVAELIRDGYAAPVLFGAHQWMRSLPAPRFAEPDYPA
jgi:hypothetical protein